MRRLLPLATCLLALVLVGCGGTSDPAATDTGTPATESAEAEPTTTPSPAGDDDGRDGDDGATSSPGAVPENLDFTATTVAGESFEGASLAGRPTVLWFWAPWCPTCRGQIPQVEGLAADYGDDVNVIGVGSLDSAEAIAGFAGEVDDVTHLEDEAGELWKRFGVTEQSSFVVLDADGAVVYEAGYGGSEELGSRVAALL